MVTADLGMRCMYAYTAHMRANPFPREGRPSRCLFGKTIGQCMTMVLGNTTVREVAIVVGNSKN